MRKALIYVLVLATLAISGTAVKVAIDAVHTSTGTNTGVSNVPNTRR